MLDVFEISFMRQALVAGLILAVICAYLAVFVVLKRIVFVGVALAQISSAGVATGLLLGTNPTLLSALFVLIGVGVLSTPFVQKRVPKEAMIGISYAAAAAFGVLLVAKSAKGESHMLNLLFGNVLAITSQDTMLLAIVSLFAGLILILFQKEILFSSFDPETAETVGVRARFWELLFYVILGAVISVGIRVAGVLLVFTFLVAPGTVALMLCRRMRPALGVATVVSVIPVVAGLYLSFVQDLPPAATVVALLVGMLVIAAPVSALKRI